MHKPLVILAMLTTSAFADPAPQTYRLEVMMKTKGASRTNVLSLTDSSCGRVEEKAVDHVDEIKACAHADGANVRLELQWSTRGDKTEYRNDSTVVMTHGGTAEVGSPDAKLIVHMP
jgi:hypothetical protein